MKSQFKSYTFWAGLASALVILAQSIAELFGYHFETSLIENIIMSICGVLVVLGIVKKPKISTQTAPPEENISDETTQDASDVDCEDDKILPEIKEVIVEDDLTNMQD